jgi:chromosome segregation ATPase
LAEVSAERAVEIGARSDEFDALERELSELRGELGAAQIELRDLTFQRDGSDAAVVAAQARHRELKNLVDQNRTAIATLQTYVSGLEMRLAESGRTAEAGAKAAEAERARLAAALGEAETRLARSEAAREEAVLENGRQLARLAERDAALRAVEAAKRDLADQLSLLAAAREIAEGALRAERAGRTEAQRQVDPLRARRVEAPSSRRAAGDQALRKAIARLARDMARLNGKAGGVEKEPSNLVNFDRRDAHAPSPSSEAMHSAPAGKIRQGQPMAPER